jgi:uncharacterized membrane protein
MDIQWDTIVTVGSTMIPLFIFLFGRKYLEDKETYKKIFLISLGFACLGIFLATLLNSKNYIDLLNPFLSVSIYKLHLMFFVYKLKRLPKDTFNDWTDGLYPDRIFNISYWMFGLIGTIAISISLKLLF